MYNKYNIDKDKMRVRDKVKGIVCMCKKKKKRQKKKGKRAGFNKRDETTKWGNGGKRKSQPSQLLRVDNKSLTLHLIVCFVTTIIV